MKNNELHSNIDNKNKKKKKQFNNRNKLLRLQSNSEYNNSNNMSSIACRIELPSRDISRNNSFTN